MNSGRGFVSAQANTTAFSAYPVHYAPMAPMLLSTPQAASNFMSYSDVHRPGFSYSPQGPVFQQPVAPYFPPPNSMQLATPEETGTSWS
ncbi:hypothetical protein V6N11_036962 [Hibiscus sabdariffa]|uniref:Uncharacterized protein n=1 Tax=Hibiscus sabdariffa TaxID=183260 RepID=A0ABR2RC19_9ROSI